MYSGWRKALSAVAGSVCGVDADEDDTDHRRKRLIMLGEEAPLETPRLSAYISPSFNEITPAADLPHAATRPSSAATSQSACGNILATNRLCTSEVSGTSQTTQIASTSATDVSPPECEGGESTELSADAATPTTSSVEPLAQYAGLFAEIQRLEETGRLVEASALMARSFQRTSERSCDVPLSSTTKSRGD